MMHDEQARRGTAKEQKYHWVQPDNHFFGQYVPESSSSVVKSATFDIRACFLVY